MKTLFRAADEPTTSRLERMHDFVDRSLFPVDIRPEVTPGGVHFDFSTDHAGAVQVGVFDEGPGEAVRLPRHIRQSDPEMYQLLVQVRGNLGLEQDGRQNLLMPGDFGIVDSSRPFRCLHSPLRSVSLLFPRDRLSLRQDDVKRLTAVRLSGHRGTGALVSTLVRELPHNLDGCTAAERTRLGTAVLDLLAVALAAQLEDTAVPPDTRHRALLVRIYAFIDRNLGEPHLSPATVAAAHHISVRYLHKLFEAEHRAVAGWIRHCWLERCRQDLLNPALRDSPVSAICARWGFSNVPHFTRLFRATFGIPPNTYRREKPGIGSAARSRTGASRPPHQARSADSASNDHTTVPRWRRRWHGIAPASRQPGDRISGE